MAQRYVGDRRVVHTRKVSDSVLEVTFQNPVPGQPRIKEMMANDVFAARVRVVEDAGVGVGEKT